MRKVDGEAVVTTGKGIGAVLWPGCGPGLSMCRWEGVR